MITIWLEMLTSDHRRDAELNHKRLVVMRRERCRKLPRPDLAMRDVSVCNQGAIDIVGHPQAYCWTRPKTAIWTGDYHGSSCLEAPEYSKRAAQKESDRRAARACSGSFYLNPGPLRRPLSRFLRGLLTIDMRMSFFLCTRSDLLRL